MHPTDVPYGVLLFNAMLWTEWAGVLLLCFGFLLRLRWLSLLLMSVSFLFLLLWLIKETVARS